MEPKAINALLVQAGVNMGDHAQDVVTALAVGQDETVSALVERALRSQEVRWDPEAKAMSRRPITQPEWRIELRLAADPAEGSR